MRIAQRMKKNKKNLILKNKMKLISDTGEKVMQMMNDNMTYFNLPPRMIEHWNYAHELNRTLVDLVEFLALNYRASRCKLNLSAAPYVPTITASIDEDVMHHERQHPARNAKIREIIIVRKREDKVQIDMNRHNRLNEMFGDDDKSIRNHAT